MFTIGFATKFYTLWDVNVETFTNQYGRKGRTINAVYMKNISMDEQSARAKYPDASVDMSLHGHTSFRRTEWEPMPSDVFPCGKYMGDQIAECEDYTYLYWAVTTNLLCGESRDIAISVLLKSGEYAEYNGMLMEAARVAEIERIDSELDEFVAGIESNGILEIESVSNVRAEQGEYNEKTYLHDLVYWSATTNYHIRIEWPKEMLQLFSYYDMEYWLPIKDGKAKRIKGKNLKIAVGMYKIEQLAFGRELTVYAKDFEIVK